MYGLTEAQLTTTRHGDFTAKPASVGTAMGVSRVRVLTADGAAATTGAVGEIAFHGPSVMAGYRGREEETGRTLADGWVRTGDLGRLDDEGELQYVGRAKEMIKTGGFSVDPFEVEQVLLGLPGVTAAAVLGVPDDHWGEMVLAYVVTAPGVRPPTAAELLAGCRSRLAAFKLPKAVEFLEVLPVNATGKVERGRLRERYRTRDVAGAS